MKYFWILLLVAGSVCSKAQDLMRAEDAIALMLKNNYDIQLLRNDSALYSLNKSFAQAAFYPRLNAGGSMLYNNNNQRQQLADGSKREANNVRSNNLTASVNLNWTVFDGMKMFISRNKLDEMVKLGNLALKNQVTNSVSQVIITYYSIVKEKQQLKAIEEQMGINEERVKQADKKLTVGLGAKPEKLQASLDLNAQLANRLRQQTLIETVKEQLNVLLNIAPGSYYEVVDSIPINRDILLGDISQSAELQNQELLLARQNITIAEFTVRERKADRYPVVSLVSAYNFGRLNNKKAINAFTPLFNMNYGFNYGATVSIPILNNFTVKRQIKEAELNVAYQRLLYDYKKATIQSQVATAFKNYELQKKMLALEEENIALAKENVSIALQRNNLGLSTILELRETQKSLEDAYNRLIAARFAAKQAETELLRLNGSLIKD